MEYKDPGLTANPTERMARLLTSSFAKRDRDQRDEAGRIVDSTSSTSAQEDLEREGLALALGKQLSRRFTPGNVYAPHDLHWVEQKKWKQKMRPKYDAFDALDLKPIDHYRVSYLRKIRFGMARLMLFRTFPWFQNI
jgi:hypothetical protein